MKEKKKFQPLTSKNVCQIYKLLHKSKLVSFPLTQDGIHKVDALVSNINSSYFGNEAYSTYEEKVVAYLYFLVKNHPFVDGNKRTASLSFEVICDLNDLSPYYDDFSLDELVVFIEKIQEQDHQSVIKSLAENLFSDK